LDKTPETLAWNKQTPNRAVNVAKDGHLAGEQSAYQVRPPFGGPITFVHSRCQSNVFVKLNRGRIRRRIEGKQLSCECCDLPYAPVPMMRRLQLPRGCHNLTYKSAQKHDARLDRLLKVPDGELQSIIENGSDAWKRLGLRAREIKSRLLEKY
jgi:hypothetical protein